MFWKRKLQASADDVAEILLKECVETPMRAGELFPQLAEGPNRHKLFAQLRLYEFASVLLAVMSEEQRNVAFASVRESLERRFLPPNVDVQLLSELEEAMSHLAFLLQVRGSARAAAWAREWLEHLGIQENNPATLARFAYRWPGHYAGVAKKLRRFEPSEEMSRPVCSEPRATSSPANYRPCQI